MIACNIKVINSIMSIYVYFWGTTNDMKQTAVSTKCNGNFLSMYLTNFAVAQLCEINKRDGMLHCDIPKF